MTSLASTSTEEKQTLQFDDLPVKLLLYPAVVFLALGLFIGLFTSWNTFVMPDYFAGEYLHFGKIRPVHVNTVLFLWLLSANMGLLFYMTQRLTGTALWSHTMALWSIGLWWFSLILGVYSLPFGTNYGWEYAEQPDFIGWIPVKIMFAVGLVLMAFNLYMTIANRRYEKMYVSLWYILGTLLWTSFAVLAGYFGMYIVPGGISRVNVSWFYVHNLVGLVFTPMGLATIYYFLPKLLNTPIYSHRLSLIGFWSIAFFYAWIGTHHMIHGPISQWLQSVSIVFSIWLFIPVWTVVSNLFATMKGLWHKYDESAAIRFLIMGNFFYFIACMQGPLMALRNINEITSKTDWVIGHSHISLYGAFTFFALAGIYAVLPVLAQKPIWSKRLADWHFSLSFWGGMLMFLSLSIGGFLQGLQWANWANGSTYPEFHHNLSVFSFVDTISAVYPWWVLRTLSGVLILAGNLLFLLNVWNTIMLPAREPVHAKLAFGGAA